MKLLYAATEAFRSIRRVPLMSTVAVGTISLSLLVFGLFLTVTYNVRLSLQEVRSRVDVEAFLEEGVPEEARRRLQGEIATIPGVAAVRFISKEQAQARFAADFGDSLLALLESNPLPASFVVQLTEDRRSAAGVESVAARIQDLTGVDEVVWGRGWITRLDELILVLSAVSVLIGLVVSLASVFVISNTVKLTVWARRDAIEIMKLVGASDRYVKLPFLIEGTLQGLTGSLFSLLMLYLIFLYAAPGLGGVVFLPRVGSLAVIGMGTVLGAIGSQVSLKQFLEV